MPPGGNLRRRCYLRRVALDSSMNNAFFILAGMCLIGLVIRFGYEVLKKDGKVDTRDPVIFTIVFAAMGLLLATWPAMCPNDPWRVVFPDPIRWLGLFAVITALILAVGGLWNLKGLENISHLVTTGVYRRIRHPMYVGFILWIIGWILFYGAIASLILGLGCIASILYWRQLEEDALISQFGNDYRIYQQETWF